MMLKSAYIQGYLHKCAQRAPEPDIDFGRRAAGATAGALAGGLINGAAGTVIGGAGLGIPALLSGLSFGNKATRMGRIVRMLAGTTLGTAGTAAGAVLGAGSGIIEGVRNGASIGWRRSPYVHAGMPVPSVLGETPSTWRDNLLGNTVGTSGLAAKVERHTGSIPRALTAAQIDNFSNIAMGPVIAAKGIIGKRFKGMDAAVLAVLAKLMTSQALTKAVMTKHD